MNSETDPDVTRDASAEDVEIGRNGGLHAVAGVVGSALAIAYLWRASSTASPWDWGLATAMAVIGIWGLVALFDSRTPLLIADGMGVRVRLGREWRGLPWGSLAQVVVEERDSWLSDGRIVVDPRHLESALADLDRGSRRQVAWMRRWYGAPLALPLGLTTRSSSRDLVADLSALADGRADVLALRGRDLASFAEAAILVGPPTPEIEEGDEELPSRRTRALGELGALVSRIGKGRAHDLDAPLAPPPSHDAAPAAGASPLGEPALVPTQFSPAARVVDPVAPLRAARRALRAEVTRDNETLRVRDHDPMPGQAQPLPRPQERRAIEDLAPEGHPVADPVIGPQVAAARARAGLSIEQLCDRTRIRPHILESIEVDDFAPCGGDFYARGHVRTLARFLGLDAQELLATYDERYAHAPINARRVFEAELSTGINGSIRGTLGGPRWSLLVGAVMSLVLIWGVARFFTDTPQELVNPSPTVSDSAGLAANRQPITSPLTTTTTMTLHALRADSALVVRDRNGQIIWSGTVTHGDRQKVAGLAPFTVTAHNAGSVVVSVAGKGYGRMGKPGTTATRHLR